VFGVVVLSIAALAACTSNTETSEPVTVTGRLTRVDAQTAPHLCLRPKGEGKDLCLQIPTLQLKGLAVGQCVNVTYLPVHEGDGESMFSGGVKSATAASGC
jgi:hypothetical protein